MIFAALIAIGALLVPAPARASCNWYYDEQGTEHETCNYFNTMEHTARYTNGTVVRIDCQKFAALKFTECDYFTNGSRVKTCEFRHRGHFMYNFEPQDCRKPFF